MLYDSFKLSREQDMYSKDGMKAEYILLLLTSTTKIQTAMLENIWNQEKGAALQHGKYELMQFCGFHLSLLIWLKSVLHKLSDFKIFLRLVTSDGKWV